MESDGEWIVLMEEVEGMDHRVLIAEESVDTFLLLGSNILKAQGGNVLVLLDESLVHHQLLHSVLSRVLELLSSGHAAHCIAHLEGRVYQDAVECLGAVSVYMPPIEVPMMRSGSHSAAFPQHLYALFRMYRECPQPRGWHSASVSCNIFTVPLCAEERKP